MAKSETTDFLIQLWEDSLRDPSISIPQKFFDYTAEQNHEEACYLFRYAFEKILDWTPQDIINYLNNDVIDGLNLKKAYNNFMWPDMLDKRSSHFYVAQMCYPDIITDYSLHNLWVMEYTQLLQKANHEKDAPKVKNAKTNRNKPGMFSMEDGYDKARYLLNFVLINFPQEEFKDLETTYEMFGNNPFANKFLRKYKLIGACKIFFGTPLEFFHQSLPNDGEDEYSRSDFLYNFTEFKNMDKNFTPDIKEENDDEEDYELEDIFITEKKTRKT